MQFSWVSPCYISEFVRVWLSYFQNFVGIFPMVVMYEEQVFACKRSSVEVIKEFLNLFLKGFSQGYNPSTTHYTVAEIAHFTGLNKLFVKLTWSFVWTDFTELIPTLYS